MFFHLWAKQPVPREYINFQICDRFGWTPAELRAQRASDILEFITMMEAEAEVNTLRKDRNGWAA